MSRPAAHPAPPSPLVQMAHWPKCPRCRDKLGWGTGAGHSGRLVWACGDCQRSDGPSVSQFPSRPQGAQPHNNYIHFKTEDRPNVWLKVKQNTAGRTPECVGGQGPPCPPVVGARASQGSQNLRWLWPPGGPRQLSGRVGLRLRHSGTGSDGTKTQLSRVPSLTYLPASQLWFFEGKHTP